MLCMDLRLFGNQTQIHTRTFFSLTTTHFPSMPKQLLNCQTLLTGLILSSILFFSCNKQSQTNSQTEIHSEVRMNDTSAILTKFNFEHFGSYDLSSWKSMPKVHQGDVVLEVWTYTKDGYKLEIKESAMGAGMYFLLYELSGPDGKILKTRDISFTTESDTLAENLPVTITETVNDYTLNPAKKFTRIQKTGKLYKELNPLPTKATGDWVTGTAEEYFYPEKHP